ncbi:MAG TPA: hypothetical protein VK871_14255 [Candidatus Limnocylindrales bacterium]|nr:hypothetical protein [Candidatus Limnocylindrales bacterium]
MAQPTQPPAAPITPAVPTTVDEQPRSGFRINEDWAATIVGLVLIALVLAGVIVKGMVP